MSEDPFEFAPGWRPSPGDAVIGKVVSLDWGHSQYGRYPIITILSDEGKGEIAVHAFHTALQNRLKDVRPKVGDSLKIRYEGEKVPQSGGDPYHSYLVRTDQTPENFWGETSAADPSPARAGDAPTAPAATPPEPVQTDIPF